ncbi:unnamed protein product [Linum tenue]|uniref:Uncharacterized protein n=1 Tax=Linum tenue TaxID=586396 RepID=A0AAV0JTN9_9ROSI|nr:unnamed protein product [Linum tenue]
MERPQTCNLLLLLVLFLLVTDEFVLGAHASLSSTSMADAHPKAANSSRKYSLRRSQFPKGFLFGAATSAYQHEGATWEDGRRPSIWDAYAHANPGKIKDGSTGDVGSDSYHLYKVRYIASLFFTNIRLNLYMYVLLFETGQDRTDFRDYVDLCFKEYGDRVKYWITINEPFTVAKGGYYAGDLAPGRCTSHGNFTCDEGESGTEPYFVGHNLLLAHATAVQLYKQKYQATQKGIIGMAMNVDWYVPMTSSGRDKSAARDALDYNFGWFMEPLYRGDYPESMKQYVGGRLPRFSKQQSKLIRNSFDFIGINYYTARYVKALDLPANRHLVLPESHASVTLIDDKGKPIGPLTAAEWMAIYPRGLCDLLLHIKKTYQNPLIYITENGVPDAGNYTYPPLVAPPNDNLRASSIRDHLSFLRRAMRMGVNVKGYIVWSLLDGFELGEGYKTKFGLFYVDVKDPSVRIPKMSAIWYRKFLTGH